VLRHLLAPAHAAQHAPPAALGVTRMHGGTSRTGMPAMMAPGAPRALTGWGDRAPPNEMNDACLAHLRREGERHRTGRLGELAPADSGGDSDDDDDDPITWNRRYIYNIMHTSSEHDMQ
jgi:hypothetical protein